MPHPPAAPSLPPLRHAGSLGVARGAAVLGLLVTLRLPRLRLRGASSRCWHCRIWQTRVWFWSSPGGSHDHPQGGQQCSSLSPLQARPPPDAMREGAVLPLRPSNSSRRNARFAGRLRKESQNKKLELSTQKTLVHPTRRVVPAPARRPFGALDAAASVSPAAVRTQPAASSQQPAASSQAASSLARRRELDERHVVFANGPRPGPCRQHATPRQLTVAKRRLSLYIIQIAAASRLAGGHRWQQASPSGSSRRGRSFSRQRPARAAVGTTRAVSAPRCWNRSGAGRT